MMTFLRLSFHWIKHYLPQVCTLLTYLIEANKEQRALQANSRSRMLREWFHIDLGSQRLCR